MAHTPAIRRLGFRLFGFPVHVRFGFLMFMALVVVVNGGALGWWIAGSAAVLTLLHELGHAVAARATGARAEIALDFLAGYASFVPTRPLKRWERAGISIAGPATQIFVSVVVLTLMGLNPLDAPYAHEHPAGAAIWWTGPVMGAFNLVPVLPLDGGHIAMAALDRIFPGRSRQLMLWISVAITGTAGIWLVADSRLRGLAIFVMFPLLVQLQMLFARPVSGDRRRLVGVRGEAHAWATGDVTAIPETLVPSPWFRASQQLRQGEPEVARDLLLADFTEQGAPDWWPPDAASPADLEPLVALLPRPLPRGRVYSEVALARILHRLGHHDDAARYAATAFGATPITAFATVVAQSAAALGDRTTALAWLGAAFDAGTDLDGLERVMEHAPDLAVVRDDPQFVALLARLRDS